MRLHMLWTIKDTEGRKSYLTQLNSFHRTLTQSMCRIAADLSSSYCLKYRSLNRNLAAWMKLVDPGSLTSQATALCFVTGGAKRTRKTVEEAAAKTQATALSMKSLLAEKPSLSALSVSVDEDDPSEEEVEQAVSARGRLPVACQGLPVALKGYSILFRLAALKGLVFHERLKHEQSENEFASPA